MYLNHFEHKKVKIDILKQIMTCKKHKFLKINMMEESNQRLNKTKKNTWEQRFHIMK